MEEFLSHTDMDMLVNLRREGRATKAADFRCDYTYGPDLEGRTCIWPSGVDSWSENSSGIMWTGVHGKDFICVVTKANDLDVNRVHNSMLFDTKESVLQCFRRAMISELEDIADRSSKLREILDPTINLPFGVVSVFPVIPNNSNQVYKLYKESVYKAYDDNDNHKMNRYWKLKLEELKIGQATSDEQENENDELDKVLTNILKHEKIRTQDPVYSRPIPGHDVTKTIMHMLKNMKTGTTSTNDDALQAPPVDKFYDKDATSYLLHKIMKRKSFSYEETVQIAISAFQHLFGKKFHAAEIGVSIMDPSYFVRSDEAYFKDIYVKHLERVEIEQHLATITDLESGGIQQDLAVDKAGNGDDSPPNKKLRVRVDSSSSSGLID